MISQGSETLKWFQIVIAIDGKPSFPETDDFGFSSGDDFDHVSLVFQVHHWSWYCYVGVVVGGGGGGGVDVIDVGAVDLSVIVGIDEEIRQCEGVWVWVRCDGVAVVVVVVGGVVVVVVVDVGGVAVVDVHDEDRRECGAMGMGTL